MIRCPRRAPVFVEPSAQAHSLSLSTFSTRCVLNRSESLKKSSVINFQSISADVTSLSSAGPGVKTNCVRQFVSDFCVQQRRGLCGLCLHQLFRQRRIDHLRVARKHNDPVSLPRAVTREDRRSTVLLTAIVSGSCSGSGFRCHCGF